MQFKLYNFHKFVGDFATSMVGTFIPLIIYNATGSIRLSALFIFCQCFCRITANHVFKKMYFNYPQLSLLIRVIPLLIYNISLIFLEDFLILGIILCSISYGINLSIKNNASSVMLNYISKKKESKNILTSRLVESTSAIIACVSGGFFLGMNEAGLIIFSTTLYIASVLPLFVYYITHRTKKGFNKDFTSNAAITYDQDPVLKDKRKNIVKYFLKHYFVFYMLFCVIDPFTNMYTLRLFTEVPTYTQAGFLTGMFYLAYFIGLVILKYLRQKVDIRIINLVCGVLCAVPTILIPFVESTVIVYILMFVFGATYTICSYFMIDSIMNKCKYISATNKMLISRQDGIMAGQMLSALVVVASGQILPVFFVMSAGLIIYAIYTFVVEEKLRHKLVNYLENNEIED